MSISVIILFVGYNFLKGSDVFSDDRVYYGYYSNVGGLITSAPVQLSGLAVGHVKSLKLEPPRGVRVVFSISKKIQIPEGTIATIVSDGLLSNKVVRLNLGTGTSMLPENAMLKTAEEMGIVDNLSDQVTPLIKSLRQTLTALDTVIAGINLVAGSENRAAITATLKSVNVSADNIAALTAALNKETKDIAGILSNTNSVTGNLAKSNDTVQHLIANLNKVSAQLAHAPLQQTITELSGTSEQLHGIMGKINSGQGSAGMLVNDKALYTNLSGTLGNLDKLLADFKAHPKKYISVSVFGKKYKPEPEPTNK